MNKLNVEQILSEMTLEEKAGMCSGSDFWHTTAVERLNLPSVMVCDGPHGLRKQEEDVDHLGVAESIKAICFPTASAMACSFDRELLHTVGDALGEECVAEDIAVLLGPGINMKRSPLCGRNFEYYSEDPYLAGELGASFVNGVQSHHVGTSLKHFAANNQERRRMSVSVLTDERTLREIYLSAFEKVVKEAKPWTVMCSYNRINGVYSCENEWLLNDVLRKEWGYDGVVVTDWGAMNHRIDATKAGLDLEMPDCHGETDKQLVAAVKNGTLDESILDQSVRRILNLVNDYVSQKPDTRPSYSKEAHHALAQQTATESAVLLKNDGVLPLQTGQNIAVIGKFAKTPRIQGGGSSHINCSQVDSALEAFDALAKRPAEHVCENGICRLVPAPSYHITYAEGYITEEDKTDDALLQEAVEAAKNADVAVIFAGLPDAFEGEGYDRTHLNMPECQNRLIDCICEVQKNVVVVLHNGSPIQMPWLNKVSAVLEMYLAGQASGSAAVELLSGIANPSGKLAETFPQRLEDTPSYLNFPGSRNEVHYGEGIFIGYRYYDKKKLDVLFPFGYGLSYTTFSYDQLAITVNGQELKSDMQVKDTDEIKVTCQITNTGKVAGKEIVQLYVQNYIGMENRPEKELRDFAKVSLLPGETKEVSFTLNYRSFAYYNETAKDWFIESGEYHICIGASSRDIRLSAPIFITGTKRLPFTACDVTTCEDVTLFAKEPHILDELMEKSGFDSNTDKSNDDVDVGTVELMKAMYAETPLHSILSFSGDTLTYEDIQNTIAKINEAEKK
ncbi:MAG: glycoside hydrolase family 3 C-terminal domain-containing protein [Butyribacter sp.]|nr:glycoside hydrolase family 3 C-terminal domain-containing protein [bacterium]MDY3855046.1 glycoside hydrolase family 3 C-terminal domain-containing protein [Butyribacter sp.]